MGEPEYSAPRRPGPMRFGGEPKTFLQFNFDYFRLISNENLIENQCCLIFWAEIKLIELRPCFIITNINNT